MKALIQRVKQASVSVEGETVATINEGVLAFIGIEKSDTEANADKLLEKIRQFRIFSDEQGKMNLGLTDTKGGLLLVSQFTLVADTQKGTRPSFSSAAKPDCAKILYQYLVQKAQSVHTNTQTGIFAADMEVSLLNDGPVTFLLEA